MSHKPVFKMPGDTKKWYDNGQRFATREEALGSAQARFQVWTAPEACGSEESPDPVNYVRVNGRDEAIRSAREACAAVDHEASLGGERG